jgi:hypothetical protein
VAGKKGTIPAALKAYWAGKKRTKGAAAGKGSKVAKKGV